MNLTSRSIVEQNITSALVMEDDIDWDIRIKSQMREILRGHLDCWYSLWLTRPTSIWT
jgi:hypothetical protein